MRSTILLAEDDAAVLKMTKLRLEHEGFEVVTATDGEEALTQIAANGNIDLILLDVKMPRLDGFQVCSRLKERSATAKIPIIVLTASETLWSRLVDRCIELGITDWLKKPFRSQELLEKIHKALGNQREEK